MTSVLFWKSTTTKPEDIFRHAKPKDGSLRRVLDQRYPKKDVGVQTFLTAKKLFDASGRIDTGRRLTSTAFARFLLGRASLVPGPAEYEASVHPKAPSELSERYVSLDLGPIPILQNPRQLKTAADNMNSSRLVEIVLDNVAEKRSDDLDRVQFNIPREQLSQFSNIVKDALNRGLDVSETMLSGTGISLETFAKTAKKSVQNLVAFMSTTDDLEAMLMASPASSIQGLLSPDFSADATKQRGRFTLKKVHFHFYTTK